MKLASLFIFLVLFILSSAYSSPNNFTLKGSIKDHEPNLTLLFKKYSISKNVQTILDTIKIHENGSFKKSLNYEPGIYQLDFKGLTKINIAVEAGQTIEFSIEKNSDSEIITNVSGSKDAELMHQYEQFRKNSFKKWVAPIRAKLKEARKNQEFDLIQKLTGEEVKNLDLYSQEIATFVKNNVKHSLAFFYMSIRFNPDLEIPYMEKMAQWFLTNRPELLLTKEFAAKIERFKKVALGQQAHNFKIVSLAGNKIELSSLKGSIVLLDFWASWCLPCRTENINYAQLYQKYRTKGFEIFSVALETNKKLWAQASKKDNILWPNTSELKGWDSKVAKEYNVTAIPANFLLDKNGIIIAKNLRGSDLQRKLEELFK